MVHAVSTPCAAPPTLVLSHARTQSPAEARITELEAEIARLRSKRPAVTSLINARLQPFGTAESTIPTRELSFAPRTSCLDRSFAHSSRAAAFLSQEPRSTQPHTFAVPEFNHPAPCHSFPIPFLPRAIQNVAPPSDIASPDCPAIDCAPSTLPKFSSVPSDVYFDSEHVQAAHSLS